MFDDEKLVGRLNKIIFNACHLKKFDLLAFCILPDHIHLFVWPRQRTLEKVRCTDLWDNLKSQYSPASQRGFSPATFENIIGSGIPLCGDKPRCDDRHISGLIQSIKGTFSRTIHQGRIWQPRYNFRIVDSNKRLNNTLRYIQFNYRKHNLPEKYGRPPYVYINWESL